MVRPIGLAFVLLLLAGVAASEPEPLADPRGPAPSRFQLFPAPPAAAAVRSFTGLEPPRTESLVRLPGDADSVFTLGGPAPSGRPRLRLAVEVNEVLLKTLAPDPAVAEDDARGRIGGDWKPVDSFGRPYQLRLGARLIW